MDAPAQRPRHWLHDEWRFQKSKADRSWLRGEARGQGEDVWLPHCWNARDSFQEGVAYYRGAGAYQTVFTIPADGPTVAGQWHLKSEGFYGTGEVWVDAERVARVDGQYLGMDIPLGPLESGSDHHLAIALTNKCSKAVLPGIKMPDFLLYGGLSGRVYLEYVPDVQLGPEDVRVVSRGVMTECARVDVITRVRMQTPVDATVEWTLSTMDTPSVEVDRATVSATDVADVTLSVANPQRWSTASPTRYLLRMKLRVGETIHDAWTLKVGLREAFFCKEGFFLNGERVLLQGWNRHEDMPGFGRAMTPSLQRADARLLKEAGANFVRLSHYPEHPDFLDECDRLGILVYAEIATWKSVREGAWLKNALRQLEGMIRRDRNHPSIILWGMGNESRSHRAYTAMNALVARLDRGRPTIYAENHIYRGRRKGTLNLPDVFGVNYELDRLDEAVEVSKTGAILVSECSNNPQAQRGDQEEEWRQVEIISADWKLLDAHAGNSGYTLWCMNDYATLRKDRYLRYSGLVDAWRVPKLAYRLLQARCLETPVLSVLVEWGHGDAPARLRVVTNCDRLVVEGDGRVEVSCEGERAQVIDVPDAGETLVVTGFRGDERVVQDLHRAGEAVSIRLTAEQAEWWADFDASSYRVEVLDASERIVDFWHGELTVAVSGVVRGVFYTPRDAILIRSGVGRLYLRHGGQAGMFGVKVSGSGGLAAEHTGELKAFC